MAIPETGLFYCLSALNNHSHGPGDPEIVFRVINEIEGSSLSSNHGSSLLLNTAALNYVRPTTHAPPAAVRLPRLSIKGLPSLLKRVARGTSAIL
jgi:hypothetical protein